MSADHDQVILDALNLRGVCSPSDLFSSVGREMTFLQMKDRLEQLAATGRISVSSNDSGGKEYSPKSTKWLSMKW